MQGCLPTTYRQPKSLKPLHSRRAIRAFLRMTAFASSPPAFTQASYLTGDSLLRKTAINNGLRVHGVLWIVDELEAAGRCDRSLLIQALKTWQGDDSVFLPQDEVSDRLERFTT